MTVTRDYSICQLQVVMVKGHHVPVYTIIVHRRSDSECELSDQEDEDMSSMAAGSSGWVVTRKLTDFEAMHNSLKEVSVCLSVLIVLTL